MSWNRIEPFTSPKQGFFLNGIRGLLRHLKAKKKLCIYFWTKRWKKWKKFSVAQKIFQKNNIWTPFDSLTPSTLFIFPQFSSFASVFFHSPFFCSKFKKFSSAFLQLFLILHQLFLIFPHFSSAFLRLFFSSSHFSSAFLQFFLICLIFFEVAKVFLVWKLCKFFGFSIATSIKTKKTEKKLKKIPSLKKIFLFYIPILKPMFFCDDILMFSKLF